MSWIERTPVAAIGKAEHQQLYPDHWERYAFAASQLTGSRLVVDAACGEGYGSVYLATKLNAKVHGFDASMEAIANAQKLYEKGAEFACVRERWPLEDAAADAVVSLETLEHLQDVDGFLREIKRVLRPAGLLVVSTPLNETESRIQPSNPYHVREYSWAELDATLARHFRILGRWTQVSNLGSLRGRVQEAAGDRLLRRLRSLLPESLRSRLISVLSSSRRLQRGQIIPGCVQFGAVQLAVCENRKAE